MGYEFDIYFSMCSLILYLMLFFVFFNFVYGVVILGGIFMLFIMV